MKLSATGLARPGESERVTSDELLALAAPLAGEPEQLVTASGQDLLHRALDRPRGEVEVLSNLPASQPTRVQRDDRPLPAGEPAEDHAREPLEFLVILPLDQLVGRVRRGTANGVEFEVPGSEQHLAARTTS